MKQMTCVELGGPATCTTVITSKSGTFEELVANATTHVNEAHPEITESMKTMTKEQMDAWAAGTKQKFDAKPDMPASA